MTTTVVECPKCTARFTIERGVDSMCPDCDCLYHFEENEPTEDDELWPSDPFITTVPGDEE